jgi:hypothetical protein
VGVGTPRSPRKHIPKFINNGYMAKLQCKLVHICSINVAACRRKAVQLIEMLNELAAADE